MSMYRNESTKRRRGWLARALARFTLILCALLWAGLPAGAQTKSSASAVPHYSNRQLEITTSTARVGAAPVRSYQLWFTRDGGRSWEKTPEVHRGAPPIPFNAPSDGHYGFLVTALDLAGKSTPPPQPGTQPEFQCVVDTQAPVLEVFRPTGGEPIYAGGQTILQWRTHDPNVGERPVRIEYRRQPENVWQSILPESSFAAEGSQAWWPPFVQGQIELRMLVADRAGNEAAWHLETPIQIVPFDGFRGSRVIAADPFSSFHTIPVFYRTPQVNTVELAEVEIWYRYEQESWTRTVDPDRFSPYRFEAPVDGTYYFYLRALKRNGGANRPAPGPDTPPDHRIVVDTHPPTGFVSIGNGAEKVFHKAGESLPIRWQVQEQNLSVNGSRLEYSLDSGRSWRTLAPEVTFRDGAGSYGWRVPILEIDGILLRLVARDLAGNQTFVQAPSSLHLINPSLDPKKASQEFYQRAIFLSRQGDRPSLVAALENLDVALTYDSKNAMAWHDRGALKMILRLPLEALGDFTKAHELRPLNIPFAFSLVQAHVNIERLRLQPDVDHHNAAKQVFSAVSRVEIYKNLNYRELLNRYRLIEKELEDG